MFISDLKSLIQNYEMLQIENRILKQKLKKCKKSVNKVDDKSKKYENISVKKDKAPSLF